MLNECLTEIIVINVKVYNILLRNISGIQPYYQKLILFIVFGIPWILELYLNVSIKIN